MAVVSLRADFSDPYQRDNWTAVDPATWSISGNAATGTLGLSLPIPNIGRGYIYYEIPDGRDETVSLIPSGNANEFLYATWQNTVPALTASDWHPLTLGVQNQFTVSQGYYFGFQINNTDPSFSRTVRRR